MRMADPPAISVAPEPVSLSRRRRDRMLRRLALGAVALILAAAAISLLGTRTKVVTASSGGYTLSVTYPAITRPGLPIRWEMTVQHPGGFAGRVQLATTFDYLHLFDISNTEPDAALATASGTAVIYTFAVPPGDEFRVSMDGNTEPGLHELPQATTTLLVDGAPQVSVTYSTRVLP
jgi:hypothetical protein